MPFAPPLIRVLLVDDDEAYLALTTELLRDPPGRYEVAWARTFESGRTALREGRHDVALIDYRLGSASGLDLIRELASLNGSAPPLIVLTAQGDRRVDLAAEAAGASDYLDKTGLTSELLDRSIRYAVNTRRALQAAAQSEARFRALLEYGADGVAMLDPSGRILYVSPAVRAMLQRDPSAMVGHHFSEYVAGDNVARVSSAFGEALTSPGATVRVRTPLANTGDGTHWVDAVLVNRLDDPAVRAIVVNFTDITEALSSQQALDESRELFRAVFEQASDAILIADNAGQVVAANGAAGQLLGLPAEALVGRRTHDFSATPIDVEAIWRTFLSQGRLAGDYEVRRADGVTRHIEAAAVAHVLPGRHLTVMRDVTERRGLEDQLRQAQKLEAVGRLAGGVAHDFNNLLTAIMGYAELIARDPDTPARVRSDVGEIYKAGESAAALIRKLLAFSRQQVLEPRLIDLNEVILQVQAILRRLLGEDIELVTHLADALPALVADPVQIEQIVINLGVNARDAMPGGGRLTIETASVLLDAAYVAAHSGTAVGPHVMLAVADTGVGMDRSVQSRIFEPFFTTKSSGKGTGLGLATVFGVVQQMGGSICVYSEPGQGTSF
jgi:PAS domain S-box-containing protein